MRSEEAGWNRHRRREDRLLAEARSGLATSVSYPEASSGSTRPWRNTNARTHRKG